MARQGYLSPLHKIWSADSLDKICANLLQNLVLKRFTKILKFIRVRESCGFIIGMELEGGGLS